MWVVAGITSRPTSGIITDFRLKYIHVSVIRLTIMVRSADAIALFERVLNLNVFWDKSITHCLFGHYLSFI
jgi:hypothetical protein